MPVNRPATATAVGSSGLSVVDYFEEKFPKNSVIVVPPAFEFSGDPSKKLGEEAEKMVFDSIEKCGRDIPGLKIICFHGVRVIGGIKNIIREVDQCCFLTYQGRHYVLVMEVKCNADIKKSGGTRKKAMTQLNTFTAMLRDELNVQTEKILTHAVWPNMEPTEPCGKCKGDHPSLYEKPQACRQSGTQARTDPEPDGFHLFKDKFAGDEFSQWIKSVVNDHLKAVDNDIFDSVQDFVARHCVGVLYDEVVKSFCIAS